MGGMSWKWAGLLYWVDAWGLGLGRPEFLIIGAGIAWHGQPRHSCVTSLILAGSKCAGD